MQHPVANPLPLPQQFNRHSRPPLHDVENVRVCMVACKCILSYYFISAESSTPSITIEPKLFFTDYFFFHNYELRFWRQNDKHKMHLPLRCRVINLGQKKKTIELIDIFSLMQNKIEIYTHVMEPGIELTCYKYSIFICTVDLYSLLMRFLICYRAYSSLIWQRGGSVTNMKECNYHLIKWKITC